MQSRSGLAHTKTFEASNNIILDAERRSIQESQERQPPSPSFCGRKRVEKPYYPRNTMIAAQGHFREGHASKIQAFYRGYRVRKEVMIRLAYGQNSRGTTSPIRHRRGSSEITMSDFEESLMGDSFTWIDSPTWSPRTNLRRYENSCFHGSSITATTSAVTDPSEGEVQQGSFSTLFSHDTAQDLPMRMPFRKETPPKPNAVSRFIGVHFKKKSAAVYLTPDDGKPPDDIVARFPDIARLELDNVHENERGSSLGTLPFLKQRKTVCDPERGHLSFSAHFSREDEPVKLPTRALSPCPPVRKLEQVGSLNNPKIFSGSDNADDDTSTGEEE